LGFWWDRPTRLALVGRAATVAVCARPRGAVAISGAICVRSMPVSDLALIPPELEL